MSERKMVPDGGESIARGRRCPERLMRHAPGSRIVRIMVPLFRCLSKTDIHSRNPRPIIVVYRACRQGEEG